jgi:hypothetical protein
MNPNALFRIVLVMAPAAFASAAGAQEQEGRYRLEKSGDGYVRMDTTSGEMSFCETRGSQLVCIPAADERVALNDTIDRLETRIGALEERLTKLENSPILKPQNLLPSEEEFQRSLSYMERFFRSFMDVVKDLEDEPKTDFEPEAAPKKT